MKYLFYLFLFSNLLFSQDIDLTKEEKDFLKNKEVIKVCNLYDIKPFEFYEEKQLKGISIDILKSIEKKVDIQFESIKVNSFSEANDYLQKGLCDILPTISKNDYLEDTLLFSKPMFNFKFAIVTQKGKPIVEDLNEVANKPIATDSSSEIIELLKKEYLNINIFKTKNTYETLEALNSNKVYFALEPMPVVAYYTHKYAFNNIFISRYTNIYFSRYIATRKSEIQLVNILNKALNNIPQKEYNDIFNKWTNYSLNKKEFDYTLLWEILLVAGLVFSILTYRQIILNQHNKKLQLANNQIEEKTIQLAKQKELFEKLFNKSADGVLLIKNGKIIDCNEASLKIFSCLKEELIEKSFYDISPTFQTNNEYSNEVADVLLEKTLKEGFCHFEWLYANEYKSGWIEVVLTSIEIDNKAVIHAVLRDISDRKRLEKELATLNNELESRIEIEIKKNQEKTTQLIQQSRLAQMGEMISMIAHQWRQPLMAINATTNALLLKSLINEKIKKDELENELQLINEYSQHLSLTIDDFRNFFKTDKIKVECYLEELIDKSLNIIKTSFESKGIELILEYSFNQSIFIYATEVQQVILNILKNAEDALVARESMEKIVSIKTYSFENYGIIEIFDNGGGIPNEILDRIFDPYFSTKKSKEGTGLGLYMSKTIINDHCNGKLIAKNINNGALFQIKIPI